MAEAPKLIQPRTLKGFRDYLPQQMIAKEHLLDTARRVMRLYGFAPIDTPVLEYAEILLGKGGEESDRLIYRFRDHGDRDVAMRFDLTVPFARFAAQHIQKLGTPFKRYHMGPVWRGENTAHGRYREFWQFDFDIIGTESNAADIEIVLVIHDLMESLGFDRFAIHLNNRKILNGLLQQLHLGDRATELLRCLDKLAKIGRDGVAAEMVDSVGVDRQAADAILDFAQTQGSPIEILAGLQQQLGDNPTAREGIERLRQILNVTAEAGVPPERIVLDVAIARGLDYYTGTIYETFLLDKMDIGSVCSGGRYDNLAELYTKQHLPGVGASLGVDRLLAAMEELGMLSAAQTPAPVLIFQFDSQYLGKYNEMARRLHAAEIGAEVYPEPRKLKAQFQYAERRGFRLALIAGPDEFANGRWNVRRLDRREEQSVPDEEVVAAVRKALE